MTLYLSIALGGAFGAVSRYWVSNQVTHVMGHGFPYGTMVVNVLGSFLLGVLAEALARVWSPGPEVQTFIRVGFLGAFTTFSTFSLDAYTVMIQHKQVATGMAYVGGSVMLGLLALLVGLYVTKLVLP